MLAVYSKIKRKKLTSNCFRGPTDVLEKILVALSVG